MKKIIAIVVIVILAAWGIHWLKARKHSALADVEKDRFNVTLETVEVRDLKQELLISGSIKALEEAVLFPRVEGKLLRNVLREGASVKKGETVSLIERDEVGAVYEPVVVPSTINGIVGRVYLDAGANVTRTTPVAFVVNQTQVRVLLDIPERYVGKIYKGQKAVFTVESLEGQVFNGVVNVISPVVDSTTRTMATELLADNPKGLLKSGMFAKVSIALAEKNNAVSIKSSNIFRDDADNAFVLIPSGDKAVRKDVKIGFIDGDYTEVASGLAAGDKIVSFVFGIKDGSKIKIIG
ncbi:MAG: efflux RND transporter periplasmic adaptor subunit [Elusimicrobium sp.]|jgi:multidrug efflux pump subunit AcrA (membrane-fusion protein)|nr:efflux RND transporter periplasmic adaptor subunit [Elusimicrobium sp.]